MIERMISVKLIGALEDYFSEVSYQMDDNHAWYFDGTDQGEAVEIKIEKDDRWISYRLEGREDWILIADME
jgi:hypothetical protein